MQLGFVSAVLHDYSLRQVLHAARDLGYDCVELMCWPVGTAERRYAGVTHVDVADLSPGKVGEIHQLCREIGVSISGLGYYPNPLTPHAVESQFVVEHLCKVILAAERLGVGLVNTFVGRDWKLTVEENWPRFLEIWPPLIRFAEEHQVRIAIENCPMLFSRDEWPGGKNLATNPTVWRRMFEAIPSPNFGLNFDPSHLVWQQIDYLSILAEFAPKIFHVHAKDARLDRQRLNQVGILGLPTEYHVPKLPGLGDVHWGGLFSRLTDAGYQGAVCVEVEDRAFEGTESDRLKGLRQSCTYLRNYIPRRESKTHS